MFYTVNLAQDSSKLSKYISSTLLDEIENTLEKGEKVLLYLNKRGSYSSLACRDCQYLWECPHCDASLSVHSHPQKLICHLCASQFAFPLSCPKCHGTQLLQIGVGTQQIEEALKKYFTQHSRLNSLTQGASVTAPLLSKPHHGISSPQGEEGYTLRQGFSQVPEYVKEIAKNLRSTQTSYEDLFWKLLRNRRFYSLKFRRQHAIGRYIADFYCDEKKLVIELDGKIHENQKEYDAIRDKLIHSHGINIIRIKNEEISQNAEKMYSFLEKELCSLSLLEEREFKCEVSREDEVRMKPLSIYRFDSDSMKNISSKNQALSELEHADIIIGTKMITTGFDFEKIGLIGVILVEQELAYPSYDASEKAYANLKQLIGRGNRKSQETKIILQTFLPKNPLVGRLTSANYKDFLSETLIERKEFLYPPYAEILTLEYRHKESEKALNFTEKLEQKLKDFPQAPNYRILRGTTTFKKNNTFHAKIMLQGSDIRDFLAPLEKEILSNSALSIIFG